MNKSIPNCILLSFPRSGNTWLRYCLEAITGRPTFPKCKLIAELRNYIEVDESKPFIINKEHSLDDPNNIRKIAVGNDKEVYRKIKLIVLVRNYKECNAYGSNALIINKRSSKYNYTETIFEFSKWPNDKKLLIYYEDLMLTPEIELKKCAKFLNINLINVDIFMKNYEEHRQRSIKIYDKNRGSSTKGKDLLFHSNSMVIKKRKKWDSILKDKYPDLFKYVERYAEKE